MMNERQVNRNSDLFAAFIAETLICSMIGTFFNVPLLSVLVTLILLIGIIVNNQRRLLLRREYPILAISVIVIVLFFSSVKNGLDNVIYYVMYFACFGITSFLFSSVKYNTQRVIHTLVKLYFLYLLFYVLFLRNDFLQSSDYWSKQMGIAYGFVPIIILAVLICAYPHLYIRQKKHNMLISLMGILATLFMLVDTGTRGALVLVIIGIVCIVLTKQANWEKIILIVLAGGCSAVCVYYYKEIIITVADLLSSKGINVGAINKMVFMINQGNELNGRDVLMEAAKEYFLKSPLWGHGVGYFESKQGTYPHNLLWQLLCEYGIIGTVLMFAFLIKRTVDLFFSKKSDICFVELFVFLSSVPLLFFSNTYWMLPLFWIFFFSYKKGRIDNDI